MPTTKGHFCSLLISNICCDPLFLLSTLFYLPHTLKHTSTFLRENNPVFVLCESQKGEGGVDLLSGHLCAISSIPLKNRYRHSFCRFILVSHTHVRSREPGAKSVSKIVGLASHWSLPLFFEMLFFGKETGDLRFHRTVPPLFFTYSIPHLLGLCNMAICKK